VFVIAPLESETYARTLAVKSTRLPRYNSQVWKRWGAYLAEWEWASLRHERGEDRFAPLKRGWFSGFWHSSIGAARSHSPQCLPVLHGHRPRVHDPGVDEPGQVRCAGAIPDQPAVPEAERAALDYATELTKTKTVNPDTFARMARHYSERQICEIVWLVASEHLYNMTNIGLNIHSDMLRHQPREEASQLIFASRFRPSPNDYWVDNVTQTIRKQEIDEVSTP